MERERIDLYRRPQNEEAAEGREERTPASKGRQEEAEIFRGLYQKYRDAKDTATQTSPERPKEKRIISILEELTNSYKEKLASGTKEKTD